jgi:hypothetical protein
VSKPVFRRTLIGAALILAAGASAAHADKYSATVMAADETFLIDDTTIVSTGTMSKSALMMIVAPPWSTKHAYRYVQVQTEFDCAGHRTRFTGPMISGLPNGQFGKEDSPNGWMDAVAGTKMSATLAHVCGSPATLLTGDYDKPATAAEFVISAYTRMGKPAN